MKYENANYGNYEFIIKTNENGVITSIPMDKSNSDYQAYLASLDEQQAAIETQKK